MVEAGKDASLNKYFLHTSLLQETVNKHFFESVLCRGLGIAKLNLLFSCFIDEVDFEDSSVSSLSDF